MDTINAIRFILSKTDRSGDCWLWTGGRHGTGYGCVPAIIHKSHYAHRAMYESAIGPIPKGLFVLHECDNRLCVNPAHLRTGTHLENIRDMQAKNRHRGGSLPGESNPSCKFTDEQVRQIRSAIENGMPPIEAQRTFGVSETHFYRIKKGHRNGQSQRT
jgi:hypothetical protein